MVPTAQMDRSTSSALGFVIMTSSSYVLPMISTGRGRFRWRTKIRRNLPWFLVDIGLAGKGTKDCGDHEWYNADGVVEHCYHCAVGERPYDPAHFKAR
jgi:hypothetical protein